MKKKVLCLALTVAMGLSMSTTAFAKVGSGDVDGSGVLTAKDSSMTLQYVLDHEFTGTTEDTFNLGEANYNGSIDSEFGTDHITADDCVYILSDVLDPQSSVYMTVSAGVESPVKFTEVINPMDKDGNLTKTKMIEFVDSIFAGAYDAELNANVGMVNNFVDKIEFTGESGKSTSIRTEIGWNKFANAVSGIVSDQNAFAQLKDNTMNKRYANAAELKADYETLKQAFAPSMTATDVAATGEKVVAITGADFITLSSIGEDGKGNTIVFNTMNLNDLFKAVADNNLQAYDTVTIDQLQEIFGSNVLITATNPNNGYTNQIAVTVERR